MSSFDFHSDALALIWQFERCMTEFRKASYFV